MRHLIKLLLLVLALTHGTLALAQSVANILYRTIGTFNPTELYVTDVAVDTFGNVHTVDYFHRSITKYSPAGEILLRFVDNDALGLPRRIALDEFGRMFVVYDGWTGIGVYTPDGQRINYINVDWGSSKTTGIAARAGKLYVTSSADATTPRIYDISTGKQSGTIPLPAVSPHQTRRPADVVVMPDGSFYIADRGLMRIEEFDALGQHRATIKLKRGTEPGHISHLTAIAVDQGRNIYVSDRYGYSVSKFTSTGKFIRRIGEKGKGIGRFDNHLGIAYSIIDDTIWVAGYHNHDIQQFDSNGTPLQQWTGFESGPADFAYMEGVVASRDKIYIADRYNQRIQVFHKESGQHLFNFGQRGDDPESDDLEFPRALAIDREENIYVAEYRRIKKFTPDGQYLAHYNYLPPKTDKISDIKGSQGIVVTPKNILFFTDRANANIDKRNATTGATLKVLGPGLTQPLAQPWGITFSKHKRHLFITDASANSVVVLDTKGQLINRWTMPTRVYGVAFDDKNRILYVGGVNRIFAYTPDGSLIRSWDGRNPDQRRDFKNIAFGHLFVDTQGYLYASDLIGTVNVFRPSNDIQ